MVDDITGNTCLFPCYVCNVLVHSEAERDEESYTSMYKGMHVCMYVCMYVYMYVCMYVSVVPNANVQLFYIPDNRYFNPISIITNIQ